MSAPRLFVAITSFVVDGVAVTAGDTVSPGHPIMRGRERFFAPHVPTFSYTLRPAPRVSPAEVTSRSAPAEVTRRSAPAKARATCTTTTTRVKRKS